MKKTGLRCAVRLFLCVYARFLLPESRMAAPDMTAASAQERYMAEGPLDSMSAPEVTLTSEEPR